jgi:hypothetical protein
MAIRVRISPVKSVALKLLALVERGGFRRASVRCGMRYESR